MSPNPEHKLMGVAFWGMNHLRAFLFAMGDLLRNPIASLMTLIVIGIAIALPYGLFVTLQDVQALGGSWDHQPTITLYLQNNISEQNLNALRTTLQKTPGIGSLNYISPAQGMAEFEKATQLGTALSALNTNPLPGVVVVTPLKNNQTPDALTALYNQIKNFNGVSTAQMDLLWVKRLYSILSIAQRITYALILIFGIGVILIVGNTIRLNTERHKKEITVLRLIGATHRFIRRPLLYRGVLYGLIGGLIALGLVSGLFYTLKQPIQELTSTYQSNATLALFNLQDAAYLLAASALLGIIGAWFAVSRHLNAQEEL